MKEDLKNKTYYAHSMRIYNTPEEHRVQNFLQLSGFDVLCPNRDVGEKGSIEPYLEIVKQCKDVVVTEFKGSIGRGAFSEVRCAFDNRIPVKLLRGEELFDVQNVKVHDASDWKVHYGKLEIKR